MITIDRYRCAYCGGCVSVCPVEALTLAETRLVVSANCIDCGNCIAACPVGALRTGSVSTSPAATIPAATSRQAPPSGHAGQQTPFSTTTTWSWSGLGQGARLRPRWLIW